MEPGPLPPHERTWRHPSEIAAEEREAMRAETPGSTTRFAAFASGAFGLVVVGILILAITPDRGAAPIAVSATTTPGQTGSSTVGTLAAGVRNPGTTGAESDAELAAARATPIGDGRQALVTRAAAATTASGRLDVMVPSGRVVDGRVVEEFGETLVIELDQPEEARAIASAMPSSDEIVTVMTDPPVTVPLDAVSNLSVDEGTAVLNEDGDLIGLCSHDDDSGRPRLIGVSETPAAATSADR